MTNEAPERIWLEYYPEEHFVHYEPVEFVGVVNGAEYIRANIYRAREALCRHLEKSRDDLADDLTTAQARIAELEAALRGALEVAEDMMGDYGPTDREHERIVQDARKALEGKP